MIRALAIALSLSPTILAAQVFEKVQTLEPPVGVDAREPALAVLPQGGVVVAWTEPNGLGYMVKSANFVEERWSDPATVVSSSTLFVNWADFPAIAAFGDGTPVVSWLKQNATVSYAYDIKLAVSDDGGATWGEAITPHSDRSPRQHGFMTLLPTAPDELTAVWLDARDYDSQIDDGGFDNAMQLRSTTIARDGALGDDVALDIRTCTCCQTSAAVTGKGDVLVAYRDLTEDDIRDIYIVRKQDGFWSDPVNVHADGWEISGCPVNGPSVAAHGDDVVVAWYTEADNTPLVNVAFSQDAGLSFGPAFRVDTDEGIGRVGAVMLPTGDALVSWVEWTDRGEELFICHATAENGCVARQTITVNNTPGSINFPQMTLSGDTIYMAWTQPLEGGDAQSTIGMATLRGLIR